MVIAGIGRPFVLNATGKCGAIWYDESGRSTVTSILSLIQIIAAVSGVTIPGLVFGDYRHDEDDENHSLAKDKLFSILIAEAIMATVLMTPSFFFIKSRPKTPPSASQAQLLKQREDQSVKKESFLEILVKLKQNWNYIFICQIYGFMFGGLSAINVMLSLIIKPYGFYPSDVTLLAGTLVVFGVTSMMVVSNQVVKHKRHKTFLIVSSLGTACALGTLIFVAASKNIYLTCVSPMLIGVFLIPALPVIVDLSIELVYPIGEAMTVGLVFAFGEGYGPLFGAVISPFVEGKSEQ